MDLFQGIQEFFKKVFTPSTEFTPSTDEGNQQERTAMILHPCFLPFDEEDGNGGAVVCRRSLPNLLAIQPSFNTNNQIANEHFPFSEAVLGPTVVNIPVYDLFIEDGDPSHYSCTLLANKSVYRFKWLHATNIIGTFGLDYHVRHRIVAPDVHHLTIAPTKTGVVGRYTIPELELYAKKISDMGDGPAQSYLFYSEPIASFGNTRLAFQLKVWVVDRDSAQEHQGEIPKVGLRGTGTMQGQVMGADVPRLRSFDEMADDVPFDAQELVDITCDDEIFINKENDMTPKIGDGKDGSMSWESAADGIGSFMQEQTQLGQYHRFQEKRKPFQDVTKDALVGKNPQLGQPVMGTNVPLDVPELVNDKEVEWGTDEETTWDGATNEMGDNLEKISFAGMVEMQDFVELDTSDDDSFPGDTTPEPTPLRRSRRLQEKMGKPGPKVVLDKSVDDLIGKRMGKSYDSILYGVFIGEAYYFGSVMEFSKEEDAYLIEFDFDKRDKYLFNEKTLRLLIADYEKNWKDFDTKPKY